MSKPPKPEILVVDDDDAVRDSVRMVLKAGGYDVSTAVHGFDALLQLKRRLPAVVLSDLNMPQMSGFEFLSVVRRRFPQISVIAMSGAYHSGDAVPGGVIADAFYSKGQSSPEALLNIVAELIRTSAEHAVDHARESAPVWIPRNGKDSQGIPYVVLTCTDCLRSFPLSVATEDLQGLHQRHVHHRSLIDHQQTAGQGVGLVTAEAACAWVPPPAGGGWFLLPTRLSQRAAWPPAPLERTAGWPPG
jgi:CheY-like chemotaxis protein